MLKALLVESNELYKQNGKWREKSLIQFLCVLIRIVYCQVAD